MTIQIATEQEEDGRWIADIESMPGVMAYGATKNEAVQRVQALALRVMADRLEHNESPELLNVTFNAA